MKRNCLPALRPHPPSHFARLAVPAPARLIATRAVSRT
jgi:hypothetical protein